ncbi:MAG: radical SAM protein [Candidatus Omnitrophota bacterium]
MNLRIKWDSLKAVIKVKLFNKKIPLIISWHLLNRCNRQCKYCSRWNTPCKELNTKEILSIINTFSKKGTKIIIFSGGEPLLREDIGEIINYCHSKNIFTGITSNGSLLPLKIEELQHLDILKLSFDGPEDIHDFIRGKGSYKDTIAAVKLAQRHCLVTKFNTTLSKYNLDSVDFILEKAGELNVKVKFQPLSYVHSGEANINHLFPDKENYRKTIKKLILLKKNNKYIINSLTALKYLYDWPSYNKMTCYGGRLTYCISSEGDLYPCTMLMEKTKAPNCLTPFLEETHLNLPVSKCEGCWCTSTLEMNCFLKFNLDEFLNIKKLFD